MTATIETPETPETPSTESAKSKKSAKSTFAVTCGRKELHEAVSTVNRALSGRSTLPILSHVHIQTEDGGLRLTGYDLGLGISCRMEAQVQGEGSLAIPAKTLVQVLAELPEKGEVRLTENATYGVVLTCEKSKSTLLGLPAAEYPVIPEIRMLAAFTISKAQLAESIKRTIMAVSSDETRATLSGIYMDVQGVNQELRVVATDTHRLAFEKIVMESEGAKASILPLRTMKEILPMLNEPGEVTITMGHNHTRFALSGDRQVTLTTSIIEGRFPNYQRVIPSGFTHQLRVERLPLLKAIRRLAIIAAENANRVIFSIDSKKLVPTLELSAESAVTGNGTEEIDIERLAGEGDFRTAFNSKYTLDMLHALTCDYILMEMDTPLRPAIVRPVCPDDAKIDYLHVLMPMQIV